MPRTLANFLRLLLGGRPMRRGKYLFSDCVSGQPVYAFHDQLGREWMATGPWSIIRVGRLYPDGAKHGDAP